MKLTKQERTAIAGINAMASLAHSTAKKWYRNPKTGRKVKRNFGEVIALMHSELSEALEAHRKNLMDDKLTHRPGVEVELADALIRILDTCKANGFDIATAAVEKNRFNRVRKDHQRKSRLAKNGKRF